MIIDRHSEVPISQQPTEIIRCRIERDKVALRRLAPPESVAVERRLSPHREKRSRATAS